MTKLSLVDQVISFVRKSNSEKSPRPGSADKDDRLRAGFERSPVGIAYVTIGGGWLAVNLRFRQLSGYTREQLTRISWNDLTHPDDEREEAIGKSRRILYRDEDVWDDKPGNQIRLCAEQGRMELEDWRTTKEGAHMWVSTTLMPYKREGVVKGYIEVITDVATTRAP